ncbi:hypothetical protein [Arthrobacter sp. RCC_34]|uniref:hypothetical protein n=1 Tax=Arthrobacter sp. RCC_34 TaxID=3239230 RepID=UPI003523BEAD
MKRMKYEKGLISRAAPEYFPSATVFPARVLAAQVAASMALDGRRVNPDAITVESTVESTAASSKVVARILAIKNGEA